MKAEDSDLYTVAAVRRIEAQAMAQAELADWPLMQRAGAAAFRMLRVRWPEASRITVVCGNGNNGGDGYVVAALARAAGLAPRVIQVGPASTREPAVQAVLAWQQCGATAREYRGGDLEAADLLVDALFGIGLDRAPDGLHAQAIGAMNRHTAPCFALDLPSGLNADSGHAPGACVTADLTLSFIAHKRGLWTGSAARYCGERFLDSLDLPASARAGISADGQLLRAQEMRVALPPRPRDAHKGQGGHVLVIGGDHGMGGAVAIAASAALRAGAGLVSVATRAEHAAPILAWRPEVMVHAIDDAHALLPLIEHASVIALGPGLGQSDWSRQLARAAVSARKPTVIDADALNLLATGDIDVPPNAVLTPHPGEAARLLGIDSAAIARDRYAAARALAQRFAATVVLKGAGSVIADADGAVSVCPYGNPGMASGGMGDALTGIVAALLAQGLACGAAARSAVLAHALAADAAAGEGERGLLASDVIDALRRVLNP